MYIEVEEDNEEVAEIDDELEFEDKDTRNQNIILEKINNEISEVEHFIYLARKIKVDMKSTALLKALKIGFERLELMGANRKALIFTESRRTQEYLKLFLENAGYKDKVIIFNGTNTGSEAKKNI